MDKYEYKVRADEIKALIAEGEYAEAVKIADTIDWRRVRSVMMLCTISDLYKINRRFQDSKDILLLAYEKRPDGRLIIYSLCELSIKMGEFVQAIEYYKEFVQVAPKDTGRYILQYRLYEAQDVSLEERIAVLEEFKKRDYREKWAYELAYLYHRIGLTTKCVEECDEMFLWFGEGRYIIKALELKSLHEPLTLEQQEKYDAWMNQTGETEEEPAAESAEEEEDSETEIEPEETEEDTTFSMDSDTLVAGDIRHSDSVEEIRSEIAETLAAELPEVKTVDVGQYNTLNLQRELAESMKELMEEEEAQSQSVTEALIAPLLQETAQMGPVGDLEQAQPKEAVTEPETGDSAAEQPEAGQAEEPEIESEQPKARQAKIEQFEAKRAEIRPFEAKQAETQIAIDDTAREEAKQIMDQIRQEAAEKGMEVPTQAEYDRILSQEYDGQISMVVPEAAPIEKQITGQLSIGDIMAEWEQVKKNSEERRVEDVRHRILEQTGGLFANFDEETKNGILAELEKALRTAIMKESGRPPIKEIVLPDDEDEEAAVASFAKKEEISPAAAVIETEAEPAEAEKSEETEEQQEIIEETKKGAEDAESAQETDAVNKEAEPDSAEETADSAEPEGAENPADIETVPEQGEERQGEQKQAKEADSETPQRNHAPAQAGTVRELSGEEKEIFGQFVHHRRSRQQLANVLDNMSLASCTGNVIITGDEDAPTLELAKELIREMQNNDSNFSGRVAKIAGNVLNKKDVSATFARLDNGALIIDKASDMKEQTAAKMSKVLDQDNKGLFVLMLDGKKKMDKLLGDNASLRNNFDLRIDIEALNDEELVAYAKQYAEEMEYSIDEFGILALHTRIADGQTSDHDVSLAEVRELVDEAIYYANKKTPKHFMDILLAKRYDDKDMIVLREKDFMHN